MKTCYNKLRSKTSRRINTYPGLSASEDTKYVLCKFDETTNNKKSPLNFPHKIKKSTFSLLLGEMSCVRNVGGRTKRSGENACPALLTDQRKESAAGVDKRGRKRPRGTLHQIIKILILSPVSRGDASARQGGRMAKG